MQTNNARVKAALSASVAVALVAAVDAFVVMYDGSPFKLLGYALGYWLVYGVGYLVFRRLRSS